MECEKKTYTSGVWFAMGILLFLTITVTFYWGVKSYTKLT